ncbi:MAG: NADH-quinone oxidoreductase subunit N [Verrucomicrobiota bacterium]
MIAPEISVVALALVILLMDLWTPARSKPRLGWLAVLGLVFILGTTFAQPIASGSLTGFSGLLVSDGLALFFKRLFLAAAILVLLLGIESADRFPMGIAEFYVLVLLALTGMMFSAGVNDFMLLFVSVELITITFYVLVSFQRGRADCLEAGVKYLIMGALSTAFLVFGIALLFAESDTTNFAVLASNSFTLAGDKLLWLGLLLVLVGLSFKIAAFPMQMWAPDVYQGAPTPVTSYLAVASKAAGFVLLLRVLFVAAPFVARQWEGLLMGVSGITILYGNLCAIPQRNLKRLLGYSSIAHAGYMLLGVAALNRDGASAILYYLAGYLFTLGAAFVVISLTGRESCDINSLGGLGKRSPFLAAAMAMAMVSLAGIPPLAGFAGKFLLLKAVIAHAGVNPAYYGLAFVALAGIIISLYYYFGIIRAIYWRQDAADPSPIRVSPPMRVSLVVCMLGMIWLGLFPNAVVVAAREAAKALNF